MTSLSIIVILNHSRLWRWRSRTNLQPVATPTKALYCVLLKKNNDLCNKLAQSNPRKYFHSPAHSPYHFPACVISIWHGSINNLDPKIYRNIWRKLTSGPLCSNSLDLLLCHILRRMKEESMSKLSIHGWLLYRCENHIDAPCLTSGASRCRRALSLPTAVFSLKARFDIEMILWRHSFKNCILAL